MTTHFDLIVLGGGTTGIAGAVKAAELGKRVLVIEQGELGGACVNYGCVPSKTLIHHAQCFAEAGKFGVSPSVCLDQRSVMSLKQAAIEQVRRYQCENLLADFSAITTRIGRGRIEAVGRVRVGEEIFTADHILIATGGKPRHIPLPGIDTISPLNSYSALMLPRFPKSLLVLGGGVIAVEMGQMMNRFGCAVTIVERSGGILKEFHPALTERFADRLRREGVRILTGAETCGVAPSPEGVELKALHEGEEKTLTAERLMLAVGTVPLAEGIGLEGLGVERDGGGFIKVDARMRSSVSGIWAAGDVIGGPLMATPGAAEAEAAVHAMFATSRAADLDHRCTPMAVFIDPELACVGSFPQTEDALEVVLDLAEVAKSHVMGGVEGAFAISCSRRDGSLNGVQILAPRAADIIHEAAIALKQGLSVYDLADMIHVYPTLSEGVRLAAVKAVRQLAADG